MTVIATATSTAGSHEPPLRKVLRPGVVGFVERVLLTVVLCSALGLLLTHVLDHTALVRADRSFVHHLADGRTETWDRLTGWGTLPADPIPVACVWALVVIAAAWITRRWPAPVFVLLAVGGEKLSYYLTTLVVRRPRPDVATLGTRHVTSSFPSGHVGSSISLYGAIAVLLLVWHARRHGPSRVGIAAAVVVVGAIAVMVALCRMYRGHHFPTDVVVGAVIGTAWIRLAAHLVRRLAVTPPA